MPGRASKEFNGTREKLGQAKAEAVVMTFFVAAIAFCILGATEIVWRRNWSRSIETIMHRAHIRYLALRIFSVLSGSS
jgi:hypothetical protein